MMSAGGGGSPASGSQQVGAGGGGGGRQPQPALEWKFSQVFGERAAGEEVQEGIYMCMLLLLSLLLL
jgi:serine/threonine-protein phosphatase 2A regulatory subunit B